MPNLEYTFEPIFSLLPKTRFDGFTLNKARIGYFSRVMQERIKTHNWQSFLLSYDKEQMVVQLVFSTTQNQKTDKYKFSIYKGCQFCASSFYNHTLEGRYLLLAEPEPHILLFKYSGKKE